jgi:hypothetical protein
MMKGVSAAWNASGFAEAKLQAAFAWADGDQDREDPAHSIDEGVQ